MPFNALAPAKVNLFLTITGRRADGYHLLESLFVFCDLADRINGRAAAGSNVHVTGEFAQGLSGDRNNLVSKACDIMRRESGITRPLSLSLEKNIPVAAGLGGGSCDAAAVIMALNVYWELHWPETQLAQLASELGADVPACLSAAPVIARGIGDLLVQAPALPEYSVLLLNPRVPTATPDVFRAFARKNPVIAPRDLAPLPQAWPDLRSLATDIERRGNDLLAAAICVTPVIADVLAELRQSANIACSGLSGSGATCFGLFENDADAQKAGEHILRSHPGWWAWWRGKAYR